MLPHQKMEISEGIGINKTNASKECELFKILDLNLKNM